MRNSITAMLFLKQYYGASYSYGFFREKLPQGKSEYQTWIVVKNNGAFEYQLLEKKTHL